MCIVNGYLQGFFLHVEFFDQLLFGDLVSRRSIRLEVEHPPDTSGSAEIARLTDATRNVPLEGKAFTLLEFFP